MSFNHEEILIFIGVMLFIGILLNRTTQRLGVPGLLIYLAIGFFIGNGSKYDFVYDFPKFTLMFSQFALAIIIFIGGLKTDYKKILPVIGKGLSLSTFGVLISSLLVGFFAHYFFNLSFFEGILLGAVISATDAAAVFSVLRTKKLQVNNKTIQTLELESSTNDPMALFLTITFTEFLLAGNLPIHYFLREFILEMTVGTAAGFAVGILGVWVINRINLDDKGLYPMLILSLALVLVGVVPLVHGNVLLSMYIAGIYIGNNKFKSEKMTIAFFDALSWMMELSLFVILGLQVFPNEMVPYIGMAIVIALFLMFVARPLSVFICLLPFRVKNSEKIFISWSGLRGATPIAFALIPVIKNTPQAGLIFNCVFAIVLLSALVQMTTLEWIAKKLRLA